MKFKLTTGSCRFAIALIALLSAYIGVVDNETQTVCDDNKYALCSHADCTCLDPDGKEGNCYEYLGSGDTGWAQCTCPVVKPSHQEPYNANFGTLDCGEREKPSLTGKFPHYVGKSVADVYSEYSLGDSLDSSKFHTLDGAEMLVCDQPRLLALCLDMPCVKHEDQDKATCYCQNFRAKDGEDWNTFGGNCDTGTCDLGPGQIWSAALVSATKPATHQLVDFIRTHGDPSFDHKVKFCPQSP